jgi:PTH1 family peptidyl-tRNA hydrolase
MFLIVGLGNPGKKYQKTPHNAGFWGLDFVALKLGVMMSDWQDKFDSLLAKAKKDSSDFLLQKPLTLMNLTGKAVQEVSQYYRISPSQTWLIHDDLDVALGEFKISPKRPRTHKGLDSIENYLGVSQGFHYVRLGIMPEPKPEDPEKYVLRPLEPEALGQVKKAAQRAADQLLNIL